MIPLKAITRTSHPAGLIVCLLALLIVHSSPAFAEQRLALVIGNAAYEGKYALNNPVNDAQDMAAVLRQVGFEVTESHNANLEQIEKAIRTFGQKLRVGGGVGLFYFSGHGVQYESENYLIPIGAIETITAAGHLRLKAEPASYVLAVMEEARNDLNVVILDACRDNPFKSLFRGSSPEGLLPLTAPSGSLIAYSTRPGARALDGDERNSPYVKYLKRELLRPSISIEEMLKSVRVAVMKETSGKQAPGYYSELNRAFCFVGPCGQVTGPSVAQAPATVTSSPPPTVATTPPAPTTITTTTKPARFQEAAQLREVIVVPFTGQDGEAFTTLFRSMLISSQDGAGQTYIQVKDYPYPVGGSGRQADLRSIGHSAGVQGVYTGEVTYYGVQRQPYSVERVECTPSKFLWMKFENCTSTQKYTVSCERLTANVTVAPRLVSVATGKTVYSKARSGTAESSYCQGETVPTSEGELLGSALKDVLAQIQADVAVHTEEIKVSWKDSTDGLSDAQAERFKGALEFAKQGDPDDACRRFKDLRSEGVDTLSLEFNLAICDEVTYDLNTAKQRLAAINQSLLNPDTQVIEAIDRIYRKLAEREPLKTQTQSSPPKTVR